MIKELDISKIDNIMRIWIEENTNAHDFISKDYWEANYDYVKSALPDAAVFVYEDNDEVKGFIGVVENSYIAGLFVWKGNPFLDKITPNKNIPSKYCLSC